jgi:ribosomal protein S18 acetylase RimI-like enzyme
MSIAIRRARSEDAAIIVEFNRRLAFETEGKELNLTVLRAGVAAALADPSRAWYFLAEDEGQVLGQLMITFEWSDWRNGCIWWIQSVYVRGEARRRGVFRELYEHVLASARREPGIAGIRLYVENENQVAQKTYERLGMAPAGYIVMERCPLD